MPISKVQPMRPAEIELIDLANDLEVRLNQEIIDREKADKVLQNNIDNETNERKNADAILQENIDNEAEIRKSADDALQENIDNEAKAREDADAILQKAIEDEESNRVDADKTLQQNIETTKTELQKQFTDFTDKLEWGTQENIEVIADNNTVITVNFNRTKTKPPIVLITLQNDNGETAINAYAALKDVSTSDFHVRIYNLDTANNQQLKVNWLAIEE